MRGRIGIIKACEIWEGSKLGLLRLKLPCRAVMAFLPFLSSAWESRTTMHHDACILDGTQRLPLYWPT